MKQLISNLIAQYQVTNGKALFNLVYETKADMDDESSLTTAIWEANNPTEEEADQIEVLLKEIAIKLQPEKDRNFQLIKYTDQQLEWLTGNNDWIKVQFTDHCIYFMEFKSGQY